MIDWQKTAASVVDKLHSGLPTDADLTNPEDLKRRRPA